MPTNSEANLDALNTAREAQISDNRTPFTNYLLGALSVHVDPIQWSSCLATATQCIQDEYTRRQTRAACYRAELTDNGQPQRPYSLK